MEALPELNRLLKESHRYILSLYVKQPYLYVLLQHTENREEVILHRLPIEPGEGIKPLEETVFSQPLLTRTFEKVFFLVDSPRFTFVPEAFASTEDNLLYLDFCFPDRAGSPVATPLPQVGASILFDLDTEWASFAQRTFDRPILLHSLAPACEYFFRKSRLEYNAKMYAHWEENRLELFCYNTQGLLLANQYPIHHSNDVIYHILNVWKQLEFNPKEDELSLSGETTWLRQTIIPALRKHLAFISLTRFPSRLPAGDETLPLPLRLITSYTR